MSNTSEDADLIIIGGGPGGYNAAERAREAGMSVILVEQEKLGGVCLNWGCIPTKTLLATAKYYKMAGESARFGVRQGRVDINWGDAQKHKNQTVEALTRGVAGKLKKAGVKIINGAARFAELYHIEVNRTVYHSSRLLIATGSRPARLNIAGLDSPHVMDSRDILDTKHIPASLTIVGAGVIGLEFASLFSTLGSRVCLIEYAHEILPSMDADVARLMRQRLGDKVEFILGAQVLRVEGNTVHFRQGKKTGTAKTEEIRHAEESRSAEIILMAVGRRPNMEGFENSGLDASPAGIAVDEKMRTNLPGVWAAGDCTGMSMLAHSAYRMGEVAVANMLGEEQIMRYSAIPSVVYSLPEAASAGWSEAEAIRAGRRAITHTIPMQYSGRYLAEHGKDEGFCKLVVDAQTHALLGVQMVGDGCSEIIWGASALIEAEFCVEDIREIVFPHPTVSEIVREGIWEFHI